MIDWVKFKEILTAQIGKPYEWGAIASDLDPNPKTFDCSELVRWVYSRCGVRVPDGSYNQYDASRPLKTGEEERLGDLGFLKPPNKVTKHVVIVYDEGMVIEARGQPFNKVLTVPKLYWQGRGGFTGWRRLLIVERA